MEGKLETLKGVIFKYRVNISWLLKYPVYSANSTGDRGGASLLITILKSLLSIYKNSCSEMKFLPCFSEDLSVLSILDSASNWKVDIVFTIQT